MTEAKVLSIIIPVYNEKLFITECLERIKNAEKLLPLKTEIIIIDDASTDGTRDKLEALEKRFSNIKVYFQPQNRGKGAALQTGIEQATGEFIIFQDADLEYDPADIPAIVKPLMEKSADVVYGSRFALSHSRKVLNFHHQAGNQFLTFLSNLTTGLNLTDMETCYKAFRADILKTIPLRSARFGIEPEITAKISKRHCTIYEVPISYEGRNYGEGKKITWKDGVSAIYTILKFWLIDDCYHKSQIKETFNDIEFTHSAREQLALKIIPYFGDKTIEIGSGFGSISRIFPVQENFTLSDSSSARLDMLEKGFAGKSRTSVCELDIAGKDIPRALAGQYDTVIYLHQLQFVKDEKRVLTNLYNLLKKGGRLIISVPGEGPFKELGEYEKNLGFLRRYSDEMIRKQLSISGFDIETTFESNFPGYLIWKNLLRRQGHSELPMLWAKISDTLIKKTAFFERNLSLPGITKVLIAEKN